MSTDKLCCFYYPTTVVILDDNQAFLENIIPNLNKNSAYELFDSPYKSLQFLEKKKPDLPTFEDFLGLTENFLTGTPIYVNLHKIHKKLYDSKRFEIPSVIIVDHEMPGMNGIEVCKNLKNYPIKKIMLTGVADDKVAVQAFNEGIIHKFILKDDKNVFVEIDRAVKELQQEYFIEISDYIIKNIKNTSDSFLEDRAIHNFLLNFLTENKICEFYLTDNLGSFLLLTSTGDLTWFVLQSDREIDNFKQIAIEHEASSEIIKSLNTREKILCLFSEEDYKLPVDKWSDYLHKSNTIGNAYYAIIRGDAAFKAAGLNKNKITFFQRFQNNVYT